MKLFLTAFALFLLSFSPHCRASGDPLDPLGSAFRISLRKEVGTKLEPGATLVLFSGGHRYPEGWMPYPVPFRAGTPFFYLTGLNLPRMVYVQSRSPLSLGPVRARKFLFYPDAETDPFRAFGDAPAITSRFVHDSVYLAPLSEWDAFCNKELGGSAVRRIYTTEMPAEAFTAPVSSMNMGWQECASLYRDAGPGYPFRKQVQKLYQELQAATEAGIPALADKVNGYLLYYPETAADPVLREAALMRSLADLKRIQEQLEPLKIDLAALEGWLAPLRCRKSDEELTRLRKAGILVADAARACIRAWEPGMKRNAVWGIAAWSAGRAGALPLVSVKAAAGTEAGYYLFRQSGGELPQNGPAILSLGLNYEGYCGGISRTLPGKNGFSAEEAKVYEILRSAHQSLISACKAGADRDAQAQRTLSNLEKALVDKGLLTTAEVKKTGRIGSVQGIGTEFYEAFTQPFLEKNNVCTVTTGIYFPEGKGLPAALSGKGFELMDMVLVGEEGNESLTQSLPMDVESLSSLIRETSPLEQSGGQ